MTPAAHNPQEDQPVVPILVMGPVTQQVLQAIQWGLEEEGIPAQTATVPEGAVHTMAKQAAQMSKLNVGIVVSQTETVAVLHHRDLPADQPLFVEPISRFDGEALRRLGANAARLVKGNPLLFPERGIMASEGVSPEVDSNHDTIEKIVDKVVRALLNPTGHNE